MLTREGKAKTSVMTRSRSPLRFLSSRRMRAMRAMRITRKTVGGSGRMAMTRSSKNCSMRAIRTRKKSRRHQASWK